MQIVAAALALPVALDGDSVSGNNAAIAAIGIVSIVGGYLLLAALWYFVFRETPEQKETARREQEARDLAAGRLELPDAPPGAPDLADAGLAHPRGALQIERRPGSRFRRR